VPQPAELRAAFESFLGTERFTKFLRTGVVPRLRYWQEVEWRNFVSAHPEFDVPAEEVKDALRVCEIHHLELESEIAEVVQGNIDWDTRYLKIRAELFPHAAQDSISDEGNAAFPSHVQVWYCTNCRNVREQWLAKRA
jgi:hypothetical protein